MNREPKRLTGKQASFVDKYLGEARFNASLAAKLAGYKATSKHSFESIGSENLTKPDIRAAIDDYFRMSRMSSDEILAELSELARTDSQEKHLLSAKVRSLALLSSHYGLLDGAGAAGGRYGPREPVTLRVEYSDDIVSAIDKIYGQSAHTNEERAERIIDIVKTVGGWHEEADEYNAKVQKHNDEIAAIYNELMERYKDSPQAIEALTELRTRAAASEMSPEWAEADDDKRRRLAAALGVDINDLPEPIEPEIIPPDRRLRPAAVERLMNEVKDTSDAPQASPVVYAAANEARHVTPSMRFCNRVEGEELEQLHEKIERRRGFRMY